MTLTETPSKKVLKHKNPAEENLQNAMQTYGIALSNNENDFIVGKNIKISMVLTTLGKNCFVGFIYLVGLTECYHILIITLLTVPVIK